MSPEKIFVNLNGILVPAGEAKVSVFDRGFLYGDGVFETVRAVNGNIIELDAHINRLYRSAELIFMDIRDALSMKILKNRIYETLSSNITVNALLRITVTRGRDERSSNLAGTPEELTVVILCSKFSGYPPEEYLKGKTAVTVKTVRNLSSAIDPSVKSCNYLNNILARQEALQAGADEGIMLNSQGFVCEGTTSNIFWYKEGTLFTPSIETGLLEGITRKRVLMLADELNITTAEVCVYPETLYDAEEMFLTNTSSGVMPITVFNGNTIGNGRQGHLSGQLLKEFNSFYNIR